MIVLLAECNSILMDCGTPFTKAIVGTSGNKKSVPLDMITPEAFHFTLGDDSCVEPFDKYL